MDETKVIDDESRRPSLSALLLRIRDVAPFPMNVDNSEQVTADEYPRRTRHVTPFPIEVSEVDELDKGDEDKFEEVVAVESSKVDEPGSGDSAPSLAEEVKDHEGDEDDEEKRESSTANLLGGESSPPPSEAEGDHSDGEDEDKTEIPGLPPQISSAQPLSTTTTTDSSMSFIGISSMKMAVQSGDPKAVDDLMERLSDTLAVDELTTTYGGGGNDTFEADKDNLFSGTSPILHAGSSGNLAVFESVMRAMQTKLSREQVKEMLARKNIQHQSLLSLAARSGNKDILEGVILVIQRELTEYEVKRSLTSRNRTQGKTKYFSVSLPLCLVGSEA